MVTTQQTRLLQQQGIPSPKPWKQFIQSIIHQINQWCQQVKEVVLAIDANENLDDPKSDINSIFGATENVDLHHYWYTANHKPATHQRGSFPIDLMAESPPLAHALTHDWILPFNMLSIIKGDHHLMGLDFHQVFSLEVSPTTQPVVSYGASIADMNSMCRNSAKVLLHNVIGTDLLNTLMPSLIKSI